MLEVKILISFRDLLAWVETILKSIAEILIFFWRFVCFFTGLDNAHSEIVKSFPNCLFPVVWAWWVIPDCDLAALLSKSFPNCLFPVAWAWWVIPDCVLAAPLPHPPAGICIYVYICIFAYMYICVCVYTQDMRVFSYMDTGMSHRSGPHWNVWNWLTWRHQTPGTSSVDTEKMKHCIETCYNAPETHGLCFGAISHEYAL